MDIKERIVSVLVISFFIVSILIVLINRGIRYNNFLDLFNLGFSGYILLEYFVLINVLCLILYFLLRPIKTLRGKRNLTTAAIIFGGILILFPLIGIGIFTYKDFLEMYLDGFLLFYLAGLFFYCVLLIPGVILFIFGWYWRKNLRIENKS